MLTAIQTEVAGSGGGELINLDARRGGGAGGKTDVSHTVAGDAGVVKSKSGSVAPYKMSGGRDVPPEEGGMVDKDVLDSRIEAVESRNDAKFARLEGHMTSEFSKLNSRFDVLFHELKSTREAAERSEVASRGAEAAAGSTKWNIAFTALSVVAVFFAAWAIWAQGVEMITAVLGATNVGQ